ncbi:MAG: hypothetical protein ACYC9Q_14765 [Bacillota bacterium]
MAYHRIKISFRSLTDWSDPSRGMSLVDLLETRGLRVEKADDHEPIRRVFDQCEPFWSPAGSVASGTQYASSTFLFRGAKGLKFSGMAVWRRNLPPGSTLFNHLAIWIDRKPRPAPDFLTELADALFVWSNAVSGFVTDEALHKVLSRPPEQRKYLDGLYWLNYYGATYLSEPDFVIPPGSVPLERGMRWSPGGDYDDPKLKDDAYLSARKLEIGVGWFAEGPREGWRLPKLDFSVLCRSEM